MSRNVLSAIALAAALVGSVASCFTCDHFVFIHTNNHTRRINKLDTTTTLSDHTYT